MAADIDAEDLFAAALTGGVRRLAPNLRRIVAPNPSPLTGPGTNTYIAGIGPRFVVIDPGPDDTTHIDRILAATGARISHVLCTHSHPDHSPGAAALKASTDSVRGVVSCGTSRIHSISEGETEANSLSWRAAGA